MGPARQLPVLPRDISLLRVISQGLVATCASPSLRAVVGSLLAVQGQQVSSVPHALLSRCPAAVGSDVAQEFNHCRLVRSRPMRGTVHVTTDADYHWLRLTLNATPGAYSLREERKLSITDATGQEAAQVAWTLIAEQGGKTTRAELFNTWLEYLGTSHLETPAVQRRFCNLLMWRLDRAGAVVEAPLGKNQHYFIDARRLPAADSEDSGFRMSAQERQRGLVEVARRYARGHGPVSVADLARWAGLSKSTAFSSLEAAVEADPQLGRFHLEEGRLAPASAPRNLRESGQRLYLRADLPDLLPQLQDQARQTMFLPAFDELHVGYLNRTCLTDQAGEDLICPSKNGMFRPLIVDKGRLVAVRPVSSGLQWLEAPSKRLQGRAEALVSDLLARLAR